MCDTLISSTVILDLLALSSASLALAYLQNNDKIYAKKRAVLSESKEPLLIGVFSVWAICCSQVDKRHPCVYKYSQKDWCIHRRCTVVNLGQKSHFFFFFTSSGLVVWGKKRLHWFSDSRLILLFPALPFFFFFFFYSQRFAITNIQDTTLKIKVADKHLWYVWLPNPF